MFVPALFTSAVAVSIALGFPERSPPGRQAPWIAVLRSDGAVLVSRDGDASAVLVARCPALPGAAGEDAAWPALEPGPDSTGAAVRSGEEPMLEDAFAEHSMAEPTSQPASSSSLDDPFAEPPAPEPASQPASIPAAAGGASELAGGLRSSCGAPQPPAAIGWSLDALYIACAAGPVYRWRENTGAWPVQLASRAEPQADAAAQRSFTGRVTAILGGAELRLADADLGLWRLDQARDELRPIGAVPEPVAALAEWQGALIAAGATAVWRSGADGAWEPLVPLVACALSASADALWLAGPAGLVELHGERVRVHALAPATGVAVHAGEIWLASGRGAVVRVAQEAASALLADASRAPFGGFSGLASGAGVRGTGSRARLARWLPEVTAQARWRRSRTGTAPLAPALDPGAGEHARELVLVIWLVWRLDPSDPAAEAAARSWP